VIWVMKPQVSLKMGNFINNLMIVSLLESVLFHVVSFSMY
jgi:hypothetical protein